MVYTIHLQVLGTLTMASVKWRTSKTCDYSIEKAGDLANTSLVLESLEVLQYSEYWNRVPIGRPKD